MARGVFHQVFHRCGGMQAVRWLHRKGATILTYHKFPADRQVLESQCGYLQKHYQVVSLERLSQLLRNGDPLPEGAVVITVDDGHLGFYKHAYPVFAKFNFPVTMYLATGPIDSRGWYWFDRVAYAFLTSRRENVEVPNPSMAGGASSGPNQTAPGSAVLGTREQRLAFAEQYMERMKAVPYKHFPVCLNQLEEALEVHVPDEPPEEWALLDWDQVRLMARDRVEFGAHSVNHPILTQLGEEKEIYEEIVGSRNRIQAELGKPVLHFAYPNGHPQDLSPTIIKIVSDAGFQTSVTTIPGQVFPGDDPFLLKRISCGAELALHRFQMQVAAFRI
jgi:peptidoglycan/xylan/chitin deacetylase (PgdA/CDA1 family)